VPDIKKRLTFHYCHFKGSLTFESATHVSKSNPWFSIVRRLSDIETSYISPKLEYWNDTRFI